MAKERIFYLDFIRAFSTIIIVLTHYNAIYLYNVNRPEAAVISLYVGNIYIGAFGVSLFLILSGAALMYTYSNREKIALKEYYIKRAKTIYPAFWITFLITFLINFYQNGTIYTGVPKANIIFSILGMDGYLSNFGVKTFYIVGEWFLGFIIIFYIIFPLILKIMKKSPVALAAIVMALYALTLIFEKRLSCSGLLLTTRLPEIVFGMFFIKYVKKVRWYAALIAFCIIVLNTFIAPQFISQNIQVTYIGIASFVLLSYIAELVKKYGLIDRICKVVCKYSYACFMVHHWVIYQLVFKFDIASISVFNSYMLFLVCGMAIIAASYLIYHITDKVMRIIQPKA